MMKKILLFTLVLFASCATASAQQAFASNNSDMSSIDASAENILRVYRNPFNDFTRIEFFQKVRGKVKIEVLNATGRLLESIPKNYDTDGFKIIELDTRCYKSGVYFIRVGEKMMQLLIA